MADISSSNELVTLAGVFVGTAVAALIAYLKKPVPKPEPNAIVTGIGLELGNRLQLDEMNMQLRRIADAAEILADRKQAELSETLKELVEKVEDLDRRN
jgi:hypothetical protein